MSKPESYLEQMRTARITIRELGFDIDHYAKAAREAGSTWEQIGDALAITKQAAQQRYGHKDHWTAADTAAGLTPSMIQAPAHRPRS